MRRPLKVMIEDAQSRGMTSVEDITDFVCDEIETHDRQEGKAAGPILREQFAATIGKLTQK